MKYNMPVEIVSPKTTLIWSDVVFVQEELEDLKDSLLNAQNRVVDIEAHLKNAIEKLRELEKGTRVNDR